MNKRCKKYEVFNLILYIERILGVQTENINKGVTRKYGI
jgi:hypothetical protein